jgi:uncharacterized protein
MAGQIVIADAGPIFSLAVIDRLDILAGLFGSIHIPVAVWNEITSDPSTQHHPRIHAFFKDRVRAVRGINELTFIMDLGESEAVMLCKEMEADFLLIDDRKARRIAESLGINCIGTLGLLSVAKDKGIIPELRPLFQAFISNRRYYALPLLNSLLQHHGERPMDIR